MNGLPNILFGLIFIVGGLSGKLSLLGTNSPSALAAVGLLLLGYGGYQATRNRGEEAE